MSSIFDKLRQHRVTINNPMSTYVRPLLDFLEQEGLIDIWQKMQLIQSYPADSMLLSHLLDYLLMTQHPSKESQTQEAFRKFFSRHTTISYVWTKFLICDTGNNDSSSNSRASNNAGTNADECEDPAATPVFWIGKWVDYSDKYGLGYQLSDNSVGVLFNDSTKLVLDGAGKQIQYIERDSSKEHYYVIDNYPEALAKKITLLKYFRNYMNDHLLKAGAHMAPKLGDELARLPALRTWFRTRSAIILHLTNGTLQLNFFQDHTKLILCPLMGAITYIDENKNFKVYRMSLIEQYGCNKDLGSRLKYAKTMCERLLTTSVSSRPGGLSTATQSQRAPNIKSS